MKKNYTFIAMMLCLFVSTFVNAQVPNSGFENWTVDGNNDNNPDGWFTTNSDPDVSVTPYSPAYAGSHSMKVATFDPGFMFIPGTAEAEFTMSQRPNFLNVCFKANVLGGDKAYILFGLYQGDSIVASPDSCSFVIDTSNANFKCVSFPVSYQSALIPDSAYIMVMAGSLNSQDGTYIIVDEMNFSMVAGVEEASNSSFVSAYCFPNPAKDNTTINILNNKDSQLKLELFDMKGALVYSEELKVSPAAKNEISIPTTSLKNGHYIYSVRGATTSIRSKMIVQK